MMRPATATGMRWDSSCSPVEALWAARMAARVWVAAKEFGVSLLAERGNLAECFLAKLVEAALELGVEVVVGHGFAGLVRV